MSAYIQERQTELFNRLGVFFAFSDAQFEGQKKEGVEYCTVLGSGDCVPVAQAETFARELSQIHEEGRAKLLAEKGIDRIIEDELVNHECFYTGYVDDVVEVLACYDVTLEQVLAVYRNVAHKHAD